MAKRKTNPPPSSLFEPPVEPPADGGRGLPPGGSAFSPPHDPDGSEVVPLREAARSRYLNYALSVITSRALPDVRDGLKPVQRRILFTMWQQHLTFDAKHRKCAKVVGDVMGNYHPHGDSAIYDALVRLAQPFAMRLPLIDGSGNFGSLDGDAAAAMRYTECRLARVADQILTEISQQTVPNRPNYDGTRSEPVVLPSRIPNLLVNGATGIAVGMATNIPPHNLDEVCTALVKLLDNPELKTPQLCRTIKGPDFPTAGQILNTPQELRDIYQQGSGTIRLRATFEHSPASKSTRTVTITSIPYSVNKSTLVERIADVIISRKLPPLLDVLDLSTDDVRITLEVKKEADLTKVMAYLFKHTPLQINFNVNMTCLVPTQNPLVGRPERLELRQVLWNFLSFRLQVVTRRLEHELESLKKRIHVLEGFEAVFDALDRIIRVIRRSDGKADAATKIMAEFELDAEQTDAILELKLYRLAKLEILAIRKELAEKRHRAEQITHLLASEQDRWALVRSELLEVQKQFGKPDRRRTLIATADEEPQYSADDFIIAEDNVVIVTRDGWVKRQKEVKDLAATRLRDGDTVLTAITGNTRSTMVFFTNFGVAYTCRIADIPATTGYGDPIHKLFRLKDGERVLAALSPPGSTPGSTPASGNQSGSASPSKSSSRTESPLAALVVAVTSGGYSLRFSLDALIEPSTRNGRRFAKPAKGDEVIGVETLRGDETLIAVTRNAHAMLCRADQINYLSGPGKGVLLIKLAGDDRVLGFIASRGDRDLLTVETSRGAMQTVSTAKYEVTSRGGKGRAILKRGRIARVIPRAPTAPEPLSDQP